MPGIIDVAWIPSISSVLPRKSKRASPYAAWTARTRLRTTDATVTTVLLRKNTGKLESLQTAAKFATVGGCGRKSGGYATTCVGALNDVRMPQTIGPAAKRHA